MRKRLFSSRLFKMKRGQLLVSRTLALHFKMISQQQRRFYKRPLLPPGTCRGRHRSAAAPRDTHRPVPLHPGRPPSAAAAPQAPGGATAATAPAPGGGAGLSRRPRRLPLPLPALRGRSNRGGKASAGGQAERRRLGEAGRGARGPPVLLPGGGNRCSGLGPGAACGGAGLPGFGLPALGGLLREGNGSAEGKAKV